MHGHGRPVPFFFLRSPPPVLFPACVRARARACVLTPMRCSASVHMVSILTRVRAEERVRATTRGAETARRRRRRGGGEGARRGKGGRKGDRGKGQRGKGGEQREEGLRRGEGAEFAEAREGGKAESRVLDEASLPSGDVDPRAAAPAAAPLSSLSFGPCCACPVLGGQPWGVRLGGSALGVRLGGLL